MIWDVVITSTFKNMYYTDTASHLIKFIREIICWTHQLHWNNKIFA